MIKSMTGYGSVNHDDELVTFNIETKTLNSKFLDISLKFPKQIATFEIDIKNLITKHLVRGKVALSIEITPKPDIQQQAIINADLFEIYYSELKSISSGKNVSDDTLFDNVMKLTEISTQNDDSELAIDKDLLLGLCEQSLEKCNNFRVQEGNVLTKEFENNLESISNKLEEIISIDPVRIKNIKERISGNILECINPDKIDENRFEQELIYYIEKLDINEETSRLKNHLKYFKEVLNEPESQGKKLGFIGQEMGREINTIGSKANNSEIQKLVVDMKDELEKIKEQVLNTV